MYLQKVACTKKIYIKKSEKNQSYKINLLVMRYLEFCRPNQKARSVNKVKKVSNFSGQFSIFS